MNKKNRGFKYGFGEKCSFLNLSPKSILKHTCSVLILCQNYPHILAQLGFREPFDHCMFGPPTLDNFGSSLCICEL